MRIEFDPAKDAANVAVHGISLAAAEQLMKGLVVERTDDRRDYGEVRIIAIGEIAGRVFTCVYTRRGVAYRPISSSPGSQKGAPCLPRGQSAERRERQMSQIGRRSMR